MHKRAFLIGAATLFGALAACSRQETVAPANGPADDPADVIRAVYAPYLRERDENFPELVDRAPWSASLRQLLIVEEARTPPGGDIDPDGLVFDPFLSAQEWGIENNDLSITTDAIVPGSHAVVRARFNRGMEVVYDLIWEEGGWRIDNMRSGDGEDGWDLREIVGRG